MIGPIFYILLIFVPVAAPAIAGWKINQKRGQSGRMAGTIIAGQMVLTPGVAFIAFTKDGLPGESPLQTTLIYAAMALVISVMTFAILEIKNTHRNK